MQALKNTQKLLEAITYLSGNIGVKTKDLVYQGASSSFLSLMQLSANADLIGKTDYELFDNKALADRIREDDQSALTSKSDFTSFYQLPIGGTEVLSVEYHRHFVFNHLGQVESFLIDIKTMSDRTKKELEKISIIDLFQHLPCHVYLKNKEGIYLLANDRQAQIVGLQKGEEMIGKTDYDLFDKKYAEEFRKNDLKAMHLKRLIQAKEILKAKETGNKERIFLTNKIPFYENGKVIGTLGISTDITAEEQLRRRTEIFLENLLSNLPEHIYWKNKEGCFLGCNKLQARSAGFHSPKEMVGKTDFDMPWKEQARLCYINDQKVIQTGVPIVTEEDSTLENGEVHSFLSSKVPLLNDHSEIIGVLGISTDITDLKEAQRKLEELKTREAHFKAMSSVGAMMAHELRTPLMSIALNANSIKDFFPILVRAYRAYSRTPGAQKIREGYLDNLAEIADNIEQAALYASNTIKTILAGFHYSASETVPVEEIDVNAIIQQALKDYPLSKEERALITFRPAGKCKVLAAPTIIIHVLHNLLKNALYAIQATNKGTINILTEKRKDGAIQLTFRDTAKGIPDTIREYIFEPFYTTKDAETSIGLGLYFCKMALEKMGASITCESKEGGYTLFTVILKGISSQSLSTNSNYF